MTCVRASIGVRALGSGKGERPAREVHPEAAAAQLADTSELSGLRRRGRGNRILTQQREGLSLSHTLIGAMYYREHSRVHREIGRSVFQLKFN